MIRFFTYINSKFFSNRLDFRVRLFNVLAMSGILISLISGMSSSANAEGVISTLANFSTGFIAFGLMYYASRTGRYQLCYLFSIILIFLIFFPFIFFVGGGYTGAMPFFFIFAVVYTVFMLEGKKALLVASIELVVYNALCVFTYFFPESIHPYTAPINVLSEIITGVTVVSLVLGVTMYVHFRMYNQQQRELEVAREEALRLSEAKSNFLANMSHEIRTPINVILGMNEMILRESDSAEVKSYGQSIQNAGKTLLLLIDNVLDVSKIESGKLAAVDENYDTASLINDLGVTGADIAGRYGLSFQTVADETLPGVLVGDFVHIKQVVVNFLSNAAKYTKTGGMTLSFSMKPGNGPDEIMLLVSVADTGIGVKKENIPFLFDAFMRADMPSNRYIEGTGLGLAIAKELTELMRGRIHVDSDWGKGSVFALEVPQKVSDATPIGRKPRPAAKEENDRTNSFIAPGGSILVADDNKENLQVIRSLLSRTLMRVDTAISGAECLSAVMDTRYDVILMDYMMPVMDGMETLERLRDIPGFDTPVVALTANVVAGVKQKLLSAGFCEYLSKPVVWRDLETALKSFLPQKLIIPSITLSGDELTGEEKADLANGLSAYGVALDDGLQYLSGDIFQYKKLATFFIENYEPGRKEIAGLAGLPDWERMKYPAHSLKSKARAMGAGSLSVTAAKLEGLCVAGDGAYIMVTLPTLYHEWELARDGLAAFVSRTDAMLPKTEETDAPTMGLDELAALLRHNRQPDALDILDRLIAAAGSPEVESRLREIRQEVDKVEFRKAERLLAVFRGDEADGK